MGIDEKLHDMVEKGYSYNYGAYMAKFGNPPVPVVHDPKTAYCPVCGKPFTRFGRKKYCSPRCKYEKRLRLARGDV